MPISTSIDGKVGGHYAMYTRSLLRQHVKLIDVMDGIVHAHPEHFAPTQFIVVIYDELKLV